MGGIFIVLGITFIPAFYFYKSQLRVNAVFLSEASRFFSSKPIVLIYIPLFIGISFLLVWISIFEFLAFWSIPDPQFVPQ